MLQYLYYYVVILSVESYKEINHISVDILEFKFDKYWLLPTVTASAWRPWRCLAQDFQHNVPGVLVPMDT